MTKIAGTPRLEKGSKHIMHFDFCTSILHVIFLAVSFLGELSTCAAEKPMRLVGTEEYWERVGNERKAVELKIAGLSGFLEGRLGMEPPKWWQDRIELRANSVSVDFHDLDLAGDSYSNFARVSNQESREEENSNDLSVISIRQVSGGIEAVVVDNGTKVSLRGDFGKDSELCYSSIRLLDMSILVACIERSDYLVFKLTSAGELVWKRRVEWQDRDAAVNPDGPAVAVGRSRAHDKPAKCEIRLNKDRKTAIFFGARPERSMIAELSLEDGLIVDCASLRQVTDERLFP